MADGGAAKGPGGTDGVSVIVPTLNEAGNVGPLVRGLAELGLEWDWEVVVVDDGSTDGTQEEVRGLAEEFPVRLLERGRKLGLASAVVDGAREARFDILVVMDADGSHPVEAVPELARPVAEGRVPMAVGSRYVEGGRTEGWPLSRLASSRLATMAALPISPVKDPMSGFFAVRKSAVKWEELKPRGFKIGLEIMCRSLFEDVVEVPIVFRDREAGKSKMDLGVLWDYGVQLLLLGWYLLRKGRFRFGQFVLVGMSGMAVDYAVFTALWAGAGLDKVYAQSASFACAVLNNFVWNRKWTFRVKGRGFAGQLVRFVLVAVYAFLLRSILFFWLTESAGASPYVALFFGIAAATLANYFGSALFAFRKDFLTPGFAWKAAAFILLLKLFYGAFIDLVPEECYYWDYAKHLDLSYFDHPPLAAWTIWLSTMVFGDTEFAVRLVSIGYAFLGCLGLYLLGRDWYGEKTASAAVLGYLMLPMGFAYSFLATPDAPLLPMVFLVVWAAGRAVKSGDNRWFLLVGLFGGLGGLAKYSIALVPVGLLAYGIWEGKFREWLFSGWLWLGVLLSAAVVSPVVIWNWRHDWASFAFQFSRRLGNPEEGLNNSLYNLGAFLSYQLGGVSPFVLAAGCWGVGAALLRPRREDRLFLSAGLAFVGVFMLYSLRGATKPNWTLPGLLLLVPPVFERLRGGSAAARVMAALTRWSLVVMAFVFAAAMYHLVFLLPEVPPIRKLDGWREMGRAVGELAAKAEEETGRKPLVVGADRYHIAVEAAFYGGLPYNTAGSWAVGGSIPLNFRYWMDLEDFRGADLIYVKRGDADGRLLERLGALAEGVVEARPFRALVRGREADRYTFVRLRGYKPPPADGGGARDSGR